MATTLGRLMVDQALPEDMRGGSDVLNSAGLAALLKKIGHRDPDLYKDVSKKLMDLGREASYLGGVTMRMTDGDPVVDDRHEILDNAESAISKIRAAEGTPREKNEAITAILGETRALLEDKTHHEALRRNNAFGMAVASGARGNKSQLSDMLTSPVSFTNGKGDVVPIVVRRAYSEGLSPKEWFAATFGARQGVISTKSSTAKAGDLGKQLKLVTADQVVTAHDCGTRNGVPVSVDDNDNLGATLARDSGSFRAGQLIDSRMLKELKNQGFHKLLIRSPISCESKAGVCALCSGADENGKLPGLRSNVGLTASSAMAERLAQSSLNCLAENTPVLMGDFTILPIQDIPVGAEIMGADELGNMFVSVVTAVIDQGIQPTNRYVFRRGSSRELVTVEATEIHPILGMTRTSSQKEDRYNGVRRVLPIGRRLKNVSAVLPEHFTDNRGWTIDEPYALLIGLMLGDGCCTMSTPLLSCADPTLITDITPMLDSLGLNAVRRQSSYDWAIVQKTDAVTEFAKRGFRNPVKIKLSQLGIWGKYAHEKTLHDRIPKWSKPSLSALVAGLFASDGCAYVSKDGHVGLSYSSTSLPLITGLREIIEQVLCVRTSAITLVGKAGEGAHTHNAYQFTVGRLSEIRKFAAQVDIPGAKGRTLAKLLAEATKQPIGEFYGCRRVSSVPLGMKHCYDISVAHASSLFVLANGLIVHNSKHTGGKKGAVDTYGGFDTINQLAQVPEAFKHKAPVSELDGRVEKIEPAPQGGTYITVNGKRHYADTGLAPLVKEGDEVEAGDQLSHGIMNPADVVRLKGLGAGRKYFAERLTKAFRDSKLSINRRNAEVVARGLVDHVTVEAPEGVGDYLAGETVPYSAVARSYKPREGAKLEKPSAALGKFLEAPVLHHTIGTRITKSMAKELEELGEDKVLTHDEAPGFEPHMVRARAAPQYDEDWMGQLQGSYLEQQLLESARTGAESHLHGTNPYPALAAGVGFARGKPNEY